MSFNHLSSLEIAQGISKGIFSAIEILQSCIDRIEDTDNKVNAFTSKHFERAWEQSKSIDSLRASGFSLPPLAGVPFAVKNLFDVKGEVTLAGSIVNRLHPPAKEDALCDPKGFYSITKRTAEQLLISYCETFGIKYRILRLCNVLGPQDKKVSKKKNALQYMINCLKNNEDVYLYDNGRVYRDYMYVDDVVNAINCVLENGDTNTIYNIGSGVPVFLDEVIDYAKKQLKSKSTISTTAHPKYNSAKERAGILLPSILFICAVDKSTIILLNPLPSPVNEVAVTLPVPVVGGASTTIRVCG